MLNLYYYRVFLLINSAILFAVYVAFGLNIDVMPYSYIYLLMINVYMLLQSRQNFLLFIIFFIILFSNYSIVYSNYIMKFDDTMFTDVLSQRTQFVSLNVLVLFNLFLFLFVRWKDIRLHSKVNIFINSANKDNVIVSVLTLILIFVFFFGFQLPEEEGARGTPSTIYEYSLIFFILFFYYSGSQKIVVYAGLLIVLLYSLQNFIFGGRIYGLQFLLVAYIMFLMHRVPMYKVLIGILVFFVLFSIIGVVRGAILSMDADVKSILVSLFEKGFSLDTAYSAYYTSESFVYLDERVEGVNLSLFVDFIKSIFVGSGSAPDSVLPAFSSDYVNHYGGGLLPYYFYFYLGVWGVLLAAMLAAFYFNMISSMTDESGFFKKCLTVWIVSTTFRWYLYSPLPLLRGVLLLAVVYYIFAYMHYEWNRIYLGLKALSKGTA